MQQQLKIEASSIQMYACELEIESSRTLSMQNHTIGYQSIDAQAEIKNKKCFARRKKNPIRRHRLMKHKKGLKSIVLLKATPPEKRCNSQASQTEIPLTCRQCVATSLKCQQALQQQRLYIEQMTVDHVKKLGDKESEVALLKLQVQALQNYITQ